MNDAASAMSNSRKTVSPVYSEYECPACEGAAYNGDPVQGTNFRGSARCHTCGHSFSAVGRPSCRDNIPREELVDQNLLTVEAKIAAGTVTLTDFSQLISEALPASIVDRVRRRTTVNATASHIDDQSGDQPLSPVPRLPTPKRPKSPAAQHNGRGRQGLRASARAMRRKFAEAAEFIKQHQGKEFTSLTEMPDRTILHSLVVRLLREPGVDHDWLYDLKGRLDGQS